jgi:hypothetical protein
MNRQRRSIGLFTWEQLRNETPFTFIVEIVCGGLLAAMGLTLALVGVGQILSERKQFDSADLHLGVWLMSAGWLLTGIFIAHTGVIYWWRRLFRRR